MIEIKEKEKCCGCTACYSVCPQMAIQMIADEDGFKYPVVDKDKCVECGLCEKVCPEINPVKMDVSDGTILKLAVQNRDEQGREASTAGGVFFLVAEWVLMRGGYVCAAGFKDRRVTHYITLDRTETLAMCGAKYVQSETGECFSRIIELTNNGKECFFVGTPCQVNGLKRICRSDKLITMDLMCLGVSSPGIYEKWIEYLEGKYGSRVDHVAFRDKSYGYATSNCKVYFVNGKSIDQCYDAKSFLKSFFKGYNMRSSCYDCVFRLQPHLSDFTIGDMHDIGRYNKSMDDDKGTSAVWVNTDKAETIIDQLKAEKKMNCAVLDEAADRILYETSKLTRTPELRKEFYSDAQQMSYERLVRKYVPNDLRGTIANVVKPLLKGTSVGKVFFRWIKKKKQKRFARRVIEARRQEKKPSV